MKLAATHALAALAREDVPDSVRRAYASEKLEFGPEYIIPKPFDPRVLLWEAYAVAKAAIETGVAQLPLDLASYRDNLEKRLGRSHEVMRIMIHKAQRGPKRARSSPKGSRTRFSALRRSCSTKRLLFPCSSAKRPAIRQRASELHLHIGAAEVVDPTQSTHLAKYTDELFHLRQRKGMTYSDAQAAVVNPNMFGSLMVRMGEADALIGGVNQHYPEVIKPALQVIQILRGFRKVAGVYLVITAKGDLYFLADATVNIEPNAEDLADIAMTAAEAARRFDVEPRIAMLSFSNFGRRPASAL